MGGYRPFHARPAPPRRQSARPAASVGCGWATGTETPAARDGRGPPALPCVVPGVSVLWFAAAAHRSGAPSRSLTRYSITPPFPRQSGQHQQCTLNHTRRDAGGASIRSDPAPREPRENARWRAAEPVYSLPRFFGPDNMQGANSGVVAIHALSRPRAGRRCTEPRSTRQPDSRGKIYSISCARKSRVRCAVPDRELGAKDSRVTQVRWP